MAAATGRWDDAAAHFEDAIAMSASVGARPLLAHTQADYGRMLQARADPRAAELLDAAASTFRELGIAD